MPCGLPLGIWLIPIIPRSISEVSLFLEKVFHSTHLFFTCLSCCCKSSPAQKTLPPFHSQSFRQIRILCHKMQAARRSGFLVRGMVPWTPNKIGYMPYYRENYIFSILNPAFPISFLYHFFDFYIFSISLKIPPWAMVISFLYHFPKSYIFPISEKDGTISFLYHSGIFRHLTYTLQLFFFTIFSI